MLRGRVAQNWQTRVTLDLLSLDGRFQSVEAILDTGFTGDLLLPPDIMRQLDLLPGMEIDGQLADGQEIRLHSWRGVALWYGRQRNILILEAKGEPLLGMNLLRGSRVTLDVVVDGSVTIDELSP